MNGKQLLLDAVRGRATPRPAWLPFVGCHGGHLIGLSAREYLQSRDALVRGLTRAADLYRPDGLPVAFDLQLEAEAMGCPLHWADEVPPSVCGHPLESATWEQLPPFDPAHGRFPIVLGALDDLRATIGRTIALYGLVCGPFTLALHLRGNSIFLDMFDDPDGVRTLVDRCAGVAIQAAEAYLDHGADVIAFVDPMTSQISEEHFEDFVAPALNRAFDAIRARGGLSSLFVCGDVTRNLEAMARTRADNLSVDEQIDMAHLRALCEPQKKSFGGNLKLTSVLLLGTPDDARHEAVAVMEAAGPRGFILAPGCDLPYAVPPGNLQAVAEMVHDPYARAAVRAKAHAHPTDAFEDVAVPDYDEVEGVVVDVITLDSTSCAPCQYMMEAVRKAAEAAGVKCFVNEHKIKVRQGLGMMMKLGVKNLPTICIEGEVRFASIIPDPATLADALRAAARTKGHA
jgi:MtaA/CmuA family methyltransferase